jgi:Pentapeptide repeats (8 copies)
MRGERLKTWASILVPIVSILALLATVLTQMYQQHSQFLAGRQQAEDTQWRELLATLQGGSSRAISDISLVPRLKTFFNSPIYGSQARDVSKRLMGNLTDEGAFRDIYTAVFPEVQTTKLEDLIDMSRIMFRTNNELNRKCAALSQGLDIPTTFQDPAGWGICANLVPDVAVVGIIKGVNNSAEILNTRHAAADSATELSFLSAKLLLGIKQYNKENSKKHVDMSGVNIFRADAKGVDFSGIDISRSGFSYVDFSNAKLTPIKYENVDLFYSNWWDAAEVDQDLLPQLIRYRYPGYADGERIATTTPVTKDYYVHRIEILCRPFITICESANLLFKDTFVIVKP